MMGPSCPPTHLIAPPLPFFNFINPKRGGTVPPNNNWGGTSRLVPLARAPRPACSKKPLVFISGGGPASSKTRCFRMMDLHRYGPAPIKTGVARPASSRLLGHLVPPVQKNLRFSCEGAVPPRPACSKQWGFHMMGRSRCVPPRQKPNVFA